MSKRTKNRLINISIVAAIAVLWWVVPLHAQTLDERAPAAAAPSATLQSVISASAKRRDAELKKVDSARSMRVFRHFCPVRPVKRAFAYEPV